MSLPAGGLFALCSEKSGVVARRWHLSTQHGRFDSVYTKFRSSSHCSILMVRPRLRTKKSGLEALHTAFTVAHNKFRYQAQPWRRRRAHAIPVLGRSVSVGRARKSGSRRRCAKGRPIVSRVYRGIRCSGAMGSSDTYRPCVQETPALLLVRPQGSPYAPTKHGN